MKPKRESAVIDQTCKTCGGLHFGSFGCPYQETVCDICHKTLLTHPGYAFCEGGKTEHDPRQKYCTCEKCVAERREFTDKVSGNAASRKKRRSA